MKTKGITVWERHADKFVLGVCLLAALALASPEAAKGLRVYGEKQASAFR
ncbi:MAG: hypothetical protein ACE5JG_11240 [Planctomycetota bacterium]